jgi:abhydrolase domain-containing protein 6
MHHHRPHANHTGKPASRLGALLYDSYQRGMERLATAERTMVRVGEHTLPMLVAGRGEPLLLLHGFSDRKETWLPILPALAKQHRVYVPDLPGFGAAPDLHPDRANVRDLAEVVNQLLDVLALPRAHVAGQSMGGAIAARLTHDRRERVASLFLLSAAGPVGLHPSVADAPIATGHPLLPGDKDGFDDLLRATFHRPPPLPRAVKQHIGALWSGRHDRHVQYMQRMMSPEGDESLPHPMVPCTVPTLLAYGKSDRVVHPDNVTSYQQCFVCAEVWWMERVGHAAQFERPFALTKRMLAHTRRHAIGR